ncbi:AcrR family transcriptional regulator [Nocardiopsis mwathae]|uniref:AcrR family transcriptional regulator n=1 Tax=Nocardiopsis mwathae TaxID=1472723 RepID=A0A7X0D853_9ACTN|nr:AcrR family transcriptional regulator [Nocardiopsis mwathae]
MVTITAADDTHGLGLRERKKARTREALIEAALRLYSEQGFASTTTEEIATAADVSQRTLFRYFPCKEEVLLALQDEIEETFRTKLAARPESDPPFDALVNAFADTWRELDDHALVAHRTLIRLCNDSPQLLAAYLRRSSEHQERAVVLLARRHGLDPGTDLRPRLTLAAFSAAMHTGIRSWCHAPETATADDLYARVLACLKGIVPALTEDWHAAPPQGSPPRPQRGHGR